MQGTEAIPGTHFPAETDEVSAVDTEASANAQKYFAESVRTFTSRLDALTASRAGRYAAALALTAIALFGRWMMVPVLGDHVPFALVYGAVVLSALLLGLGPSIAASVMGIVCVRVFFAPNGFFTISSVYELSETLTYIGGCFLITGAAEMTRRSKERLKLANLELARRAEALSLFNEELEKRVVERTMQLKRAEESARQLGAQVLRLQDDERRRIARDLHESVGQAAAVLSMNLGQLERSDSLSPQDSVIVSDTKAIAKNVAEEVRTISYLLHPPLLDEMGLPLALKWYVKGFSQRSGIDTDLELSSDFGRLPGDLEIAIFRVVQEALTNVLRHSGSTRASVRLRRFASSVEVEIMDEGKGIPVDEQGDFASGGMLGVGLRGMRERAVQLGGRLELHSTTRGTIVIAKFPAGMVEAAPVADQAVA
ncbi:MAG TPA: sensor histidine kinase [Candidatus Acidoferrum sp.]|jgi:signal transduction histidine kinase|nr:sensor histidine kinase [Candidatus Acidoferrum sp.]